MRALTTALIVLVAIVNLAPGAGVLSAERLQALYGIPISDPNLLILMRHRAVLLAIVGGVLAASAVIPSLRPLGFFVGLVSMVSFVVLTLVVGEYDLALKRVMLVDVAASFGLVAAAVLDRVGRRD